MAGRRRLQSPSPFPIGWPGLGRALLIGGTAALVALYLKRQSNAGYDRPGGRSRGPPQGSGGDGGSGGAGSGGTKKSPVRPSRRRRSRRTLPPPPSPSALAAMQSVLENDYVAPLVLDYLPVRDLLAVAGVSPRLFAAAAMDELWRPHVPAKLWFWERDKAPRDARFAAEMVKAAFDAPALRATFYVQGNGSQQLYGPPSELPGLRHAMFLRASMRTGSPPAASSSAAAGSGGGKSGNGGKGGDGVHPLSPCSSSGGNGRPFRSSDDDDDNDDVDSSDDGDGDGYGVSSSDRGGGGGGGGGGAHGPVPWRRFYSTMLRTAHPYHVQLQHTTGRKGWTPFQAGSVIRDRMRVRSAEQVASFVSGTNRTSPPTPRLTENACPHHLFYVLQDLTRDIGAEEVLLERIVHDDDDDDDDHIRSGGNGGDGSGSEDGGGDGGGGNGCAPRVTTITKGRCEAVVRGFLTFYDAAERRGLMCLARREEPVWNAGFVLELTGGRRYSFHHARFRADCDEAGVAWWAALGVLREGVARYDEQRGGEGGERRG